MERVDFPNSAGHLLAARLERPPQEPLAYALFAHCFTCGKDNLAAKRIAEALTARDIAVLRFDFTGLGASEGDFANTNFSSNVADLVAAADHLRTTRRAPALLIGHSLGGAAVLAAAAEVPEARAVVTIAAPSDPAHVVGLFRDRVETIRERGEGEVELFGRSFRIRREFLADAAEQKLLERVAALRKALLDSSAANWSLATRPEERPMPWAEKDMSIVLKEADAARLSLPLCGVVKETIKAVKTERGWPMPKSPED